MKLKYIFLTFVAFIALGFTSCEDNKDITLLDAVQVSSSYVSIPVEGGESSIIVKASTDWTMEKVVTKTDSVKWLSITKGKDNEGNELLTFKADKTLDGRSAQVLIHCAGETQYVNVIQGLSKKEVVTVANVLAGPTGKAYRVKGIVSSISNTLYGNWILKDKTGEILIYGTKDKKGNKKNFASLGIEVGDEVTVEGPKKIYGSTIELVDVEVLNIVKSLIKVDSVFNDTIAVGGGETTVHLTCKGQGVSVEIPESAKSWLAISSIQSRGTNAVVKFMATANAGGDRHCKIVFHTTDGKKDYTSETTIMQLGAIVKASVANFLAAPVGETQYRLTGIVTKIKNAEYGNVYLKDFSGEVYVYGLHGFKGKDVKEGDIITVVGKRGEFKGTPQMVKGALENVKHVTPITIADVLKKPDSKEVHYLVTGTIKEIKNADYGNMTLKDGDSEIYLYGCYPGYGATDDARKGAVGKLGLKIGDKLTVIATKSSYKRTVQLANGVYYQHESAK